MGIFDWVSQLLGGKPAGPARAANDTPKSWQPPPVPALVPTPTVSTSPAQPPAPKPNKVLTGLDLGAFAPLSASEMHAAADQLGSAWGNPWFGRRDLIPPVSDPRTRLIDRGMVGTGLITAEELTAIHEVGETMDRLRPDLLQAQLTAQKAVEQAQADRAELKRQKQAAAAERKAQRRAEILHRRETDIIYLGRGVSKGLADCQSDLQRLLQSKLPVLSTPANVATALGISIGQLRWLAFHNPTARRTHYVTFHVAKKCGGLRQLAAPHRRLRHCQTWILQNILAKVPLHDAAHGFVPGRGTVSNATPHVKQQVVLNADLVDFFPSIDFSRVKGIFRSFGYSPSVATILALLCTESPRREMTYNGTTYQVATGHRRLPQGACTSPALSNLASRRLDKRLSGIANKLGWTYTRYADDLTFSANGATTRNIGYLLARLRHIAADCGFAVNEQKTRVQRQHTQQSVTGVVVNQRTAAPRKLVRQLRAILHRAQHEGLRKQNRQNLPHFESWLLGNIAYISMLNADQGRKLRAAYDALQPR